MAISINGTSGISGVDGSAGTPAIQGTDTNTGISFGTDEINLNTGGTTRATVDSSGRLLVGTNSALGNIKRFGNSITPTQQISTAAGSWNNGLSLINYSASGFSPTLTLGLSLSDTQGTNALVSSGERMGVISFTGNDGTDFEEGCRIEAQVDGTPGANDMPGRLVFSTTAAGAPSPTERLRIGADGVLVKYGNSSTARIYPQTDNAGYIGASTRRWQAIYAVNGTIQTSDEREKTEIIDSPLGTDFIKSLRPVAYKWKVGGYEHSVDEEGEDVFTPIPGERTHWGFIAQDVKQAVDSAGVDFGGWLLDDKNDPDSQQALRYDQFIAPLTKALQEALTKIETLEARLTALEGGAN